MGPFDHFCLALDKTDPIKDWAGTFGVTPETRRMSRPEDVFRTIVAALAKHKDLQLVLSIGDQLDPEQIGPIPSNAIIVKRAPQLELLKRASVLHHSRGVKHCAGVSGPRCPSSSHSGRL
jgi:hypothetical protein